MKTLYVSDLDGTLLDNNSRISERSADIITRLTRRGALITVATARTPATVSNLLEHTATTPPAIVMTGATMWNRNTGRYVDPRFMSAGVYDVVDREIRRCGLRPFVYALDLEKSFIDVYHDFEMTHEEQEFYEPRRSLKLKTFHIGSAVPDGNKAQVILVFAIGPRSQCEAAAEALRQHGGCSVSCYPDIFNSDNAIIEVYAPGVSKAEAVTRLKKMTGADRLVVFGDNLNDLSMFAVADVSVAVGNALAEVKEAADYVTGVNLSDAVARFIESDYNEHI